MPESQTPKKLDRVATAPEIIEMAKALADEPELFGILVGIQLLQGQMSRKIITAGLSLDDHREQTIRGIRTIIPNFLPN